MHKWAFAALLAIACVIGIGFTIQTIIEEEKNRVDEIVQDNELRFIATNFEFDEEEYHVTVGETLELTLRNQGGTHGLDIEGLGISLYEGDRITYTFDTPGTYNIVCNIACGLGHLDMKSVLIVSEASPNEQPAN